MFSACCDQCEGSPALVHCSADGAFLCKACDTAIHSVNKLAMRHERIPVSRVGKRPRRFICDHCQSNAAAVYCNVDNACLCATCDASIHTANKLAARHERIPLDTFFTENQNLPSVPLCGTQDTQGRSGNSGKLCQSISPTPSVDSFLADAEKLGDTEENWLDDSVYDFSSLNYVNSFGDLGSDFPNSLLENTSPPLPVPTEQKILRPSSPPQTVQPKNHPISTTLVPPQPPVPDSNIVHINQPTIPVSGSNPSNAQGVKYKPQLQEKRQGSAKSTLPAPAAAPSPNSGASSAVNSRASRPASSLRAHSQGSIQTLGPTGAVKLISSKDPVSSKSKPHPTSSISDPATPSASASKSARASSAPSASSEQQTSEDKLKDFKLPPMAKLSTVHGYWGMEELPAERALLLAQQAMRQGGGGSTEAATTSQPSGRDSKGAVKMDPNDRNMGYGPGIGMPPQQPPQGRPHRFDGGNGSGGMMIVGPGCPGPPGGTASRNGMFHPSSSNTEATAQGHMHPPRMAGPGGPMVMPMGPGSAPGSHTGPPGRGGPTSAMYGPIPHRQPPNNSVSNHPPPHRPMQQPGHPGHDVMMQAPNMMQAPHRGGPQVAPNGMTHISAHHPYAQMGGYVPPHMHMAAVAGQRHAQLQRYRAKRRARAAAVASEQNKKVRYECRKTLADNRPRIKGRFAKGDEESESSASALDADSNLISADSLSEYSSRRTHTNMMMEDGRAQRGRTDEQQQQRGDMLSNMGGLDESDEESLGEVGQHLFDSSCGGSSALQHPDKLQDWWLADVSNCVEPMTDFQ